VIEPNDPSLFVTPEQRQQWLTLAPTEQVAGFDYSLWKTSTPRPLELPRFSRTFSLGVPALVVGLIAAARYAVDRSLIGDNVPLGVIAVIVAALFPCTLVWGVFQLRREHHGDSFSESETPPATVPSHSIAARSSVGRRGRALGWLWFEDDELCFRGTDFDFRLKRSDIRSKRSGLKLFCSEDGMVLNRPGGISAHQLWIHPGFFANGRFIGKRKLWKGLEAEISLWEHSPVSGSPSLFPPVRPTACEPFRLTWVGWISPPLYMGILFSFVGLLLPSTEGVHRTPIGVAGAGVIIGLAWLVTLWSANLSGDSLNREVEKVLGRSNRMVP